MGALPRGVWVLFVAVLVNRVGTMVLPFLTLYLTHELGWTPGRAGFVLALYGAGAIVAAPLSGRLADRVGPVIVMRASLVLTAALLVLFPIFSARNAVLGCALALAAATEAFRPASMALMATMVRPSQRKAAYAVNRLAVNLGMSVGPAVGGLVAARSFDLLFWLDGATTLAAGLILMSPLSRALAPCRDDGTQTGRADSAERTAPASGAEDRRPYRDFAYVTFLVASALAAAVFFQHVSAMPLHLVDALAFSPSFYGGLFTLNTLMIVLLEVRLNVATSHWSHARTLLAGSLLLGVGFGGLAFSSRGWAVAATVVAWTFGEMMLLPGMANFVAEVAPTRRIGEYMGTFSMSWGVAFALGPWAGTVVLHEIGSTALWAGCFVVAAVAGVLMHVAARVQSARL